MAVPCQHPISCRRKTRRDPDLLQARAGDAREVLGEVGRAEVEDGVLVPHLGEAGDALLQVARGGEVIVAHLGALLQEGVLAQRLGVDLPGGGVVGRSRVGGLGQVERLLSPGQVARVQLGIPGRRDQVICPAHRLGQRRGLCRRGEGGGQLVGLPAEPAQLLVVDVAHDAGDRGDQLLVVWAGGQVRGQRHGRRGLVNGVARVDPGQRLIVDRLQGIALGCQRALHARRPRDRRPVRGNEVGRGQADHLVQHRNALWDRYAGLADGARVRQVPAGVAGDQDSLVRHPDHEPGAAIHGPAQLHRGDSVQVESLGLRDQVRGGGIVRKKNRRVLPH